MASILIAGAIAASASLAAAADVQRPSASPLVSSVEACRAIRDNAQRLACFDRETARLVSAVRGGAVTVLDKAEVRQARRSLFGLPLPKLPFFSGDRSADDAPVEIQSTIKSVQGIGRGRYRMVIADHNAVWETIDNPTRLHPPQAGDKIVIRRGMLGSYFLRIAGQIGIKGRRVS
ncbi:MAG: hypothetical protein M3428_02715 [Pseudomonadota bacterium]|nr:hypothetical protein [Pseudomonadota bacterium]